jgi:glycosyltransferase involved in cell wall biosynthesis
MKILIVVPCRNESLNLIPMLESINEQDLTYICGVVIVENNSSDDTFEKALSIAKASQAYGFPLHVLKYSKEGSLFNAAEFQAFAHGVSHELPNFPETTHVMKLDADVRLESNYLSTLGLSHDAFDLAGGRLKNEQTWNVPGCVKLYSLQALELVLKLPAALGWDVIDEVLLRRHGLVVIYCTDAKYKVARVTGSSEGLLRGRKRLGVVCKFVGYSRMYFMLKFVRFIFRKPYVSGSVAMALGYLSSGKSPFSPELISLYKMEQVAKLNDLFKNPIKWLARTYR